MIVLAAMALVMLAVTPNTSAAGLTEDGVTQAGARRLLAFNSTKEVADNYLSKYPDYAVYTCDNRDFVKYNCFISSIQGQKNQTYAIDAGPDGVNYRTYVFSSALVQFFDGPATVSTRGCITGKTADNSTGFPLISETLTGYVNAVRGQCPTSG